MVNLYLVVEISYCNQYIVLNNWVAIIDAVHNSSDHKLSLANVLLEMDPTVWSVLLLLLKIE